MKGEESGRWGAWLGGWWIYRRDVRGVGGEWVQVME